jgi:hypothetical protein
MEFMDIVTEARLITIFAAMDYVNPEMDLGVRLAIGFNTLAAENSAIETQNRANRDVALATADWAEWLARNSY